MAVRRIYWATDALETLEDRGYDGGELQWKSPYEFRSVTYNQSGLDVDGNAGRTDHATLWLSGIGEFDLHYHRPLPDDAAIKQVILKKEMSGKWFASIVVDTDEDYPDPPDPAAIDVADTVGIDLGILTFVHDSDGVAVSPPDVSDHLDRIDKRHRTLSRKQHGSNNWETARRRLAAAYEDLRNMFNDFREKLAHSYTTEYDAVFLEGLNTRGLLRVSSNGRNIALLSWSETIQTFERHGRKHGCHVVTVPPEGTTKRCARCGVKTDKPVWVREHSCPSCGFETDRAQNAAFEVQTLGLEEFGVKWSLDDALGQGRVEATPAETATTADFGDWTGSIHEVCARCVVETGKPHATAREGSSLNCPPRLP